MKEKNTYPFPLIIIEVAYQNSEIFFVGNKAVKCKSWEKVDCYISYIWSSLLSYIGTFSKLLIW